MSSTTSSVPSGPSTTESDSGTSSNRTATSMRPNGDPQATNNSSSSATTISNPIVTLGTMSTASSNISSAASSSPPSSPATPTTPTILDSPISSSNSSSTPPEGSLSGFRTLPSTTWSTDIPTSITQPPSSTSFWPISPWPVPPPSMSTILASPIPLFNLSSTPPQGSFLGLATLPSTTWPTDRSGPIIQPPSSTPFRPISPWPIPPASVPTILASSVPFFNSSSTPSHGAPLGFTTLHSTAWPTDRSAPMIHPPSSTPSWPTSLWPIPPHSTPHSIGPTASQGSLGRPWETTSTWSNTAAQSKQPKVIGPSIESPQPYEVSPYRGPNPLPSSEPLQTYQVSPYRGPNPPPSSDQVPVDTVDA
ncbi:hypothetical protein F4803DRAFT_518297 [Xylaria telfairii]|nr:hypothetical protein F4803DRAFT_518297 [Xylaria telfairii]